MKCAVLGDPIAHSLSPVLHRAGYAAAGLEGWSYGSARVGEDGLADLVAALDEDWRGLSLTMPLKRVALRLAVRCTDRALLAGAANTLLVEDGTPVLADNTDLPGAVAALRERYDGPVTSATVLGGGATAASTGLALCELGARTVTLLVRSPDRAAEAVEALARHPSGVRVEVARLADGPVQGEVVVSTIPAAAQEPQLVARCAEAPVVFEALYDPWPTPLAAASSGVLVSGLDLLVHQAALQFELFTGAPAPLDAMRTAGAEALARRQAAG